MRGGKTPSVAKREEIRVLGNNGTFTPADGGNSDFEGEVAVP